LYKSPPIRPLVNDGKLPTRRFLSFSRLIEENTSHASCIQTLRLRRRPPRKLLVAQYIKFLLALFHHSSSLDKLCLTLNWDGPVTPAILSLNTAIASLSSLRALQISEMSSLDVDLIHRIRSPLVRIDLARVHVQGADDGHSIHDQRESPELRRDGSPALLLRGFSASLAELRLENFTLDSTNVTFPSVRSLKLITRQHPPRLKPLIQSFPNLRSLSFGSYTYGEPIQWPSQSEVAAVQYANQTAQSKQIWEDLDYVEASISDLFFLNIHCPIRYLHITPYRTAAYLDKVAVWGDDPRYIHELRPEFLSSILHNSNPVHLSIQCISAETLPDHSFEEAPLWLSTSKQRFTHLNIEIPISPPELERWKRAIDFVLALIANSSQSLEYISLVIPIGFPNQFENDDVPVANYVPDPHSFECGTLGVQKERG